MPEKNIIHRIKYFSNEFCSILTVWLLTSLFSHLSKIRQRSDSIFIVKKKNSRKNKSGYQNRIPWTLRCHLEQCLPCSWSLWPPQTRSGRRLSSVHPLRQSTTDCCGSQSDSTLEGWGNPRPSCKRSGYVRMYRTCGTRNSDTWWCLRWWVDWLFLPCRWHVEGTRSLCRCSSRFLWCGHWKVQCWWCQCLLVLWSNQTDHPLPVSRYTVQTQSYSPTGMELKQLQKSLKNALFSGEILCQECETKYQYLIAAWKIKELENSYLWLIEFF